MAQDYTLNVNGAARTVTVEPGTPLLYVLRNDLELSGPRFGCGLSQCGACTVLIDGHRLNTSNQASAGTTSTQGVNQRW